MKQVDDIKALLVRKRTWPVIALFVVMMVVGHYMESHKLGFGDLARSGARLTQSLYRTLDEQQPSDVIRRYGEAIYGDTGACARDCGPHNIFSFAFTVVTVTPQVARESWRSGNWFTRILLVATIGLVIMLVWEGITDRREDLAQRLVLVPFAFVVGPVAVALVFWLALLLLMLVTILVGEVLSGAVFVIGTFGGIWKIGKLTIETLKHADELGERGVPFVKKLFGVRAPPPAGVAPPPAPPVVAPPPTAPPPTVPPPAGG